MSELPPHLADVPLEVRAELACPPMKLRQVLELRPGSVLSTGKLTGYSVELIVAGLSVGAARLLDRPGPVMVRLLHLASPK